jgi:hypothetical protein
MVLLIVEYRWEFDHLIADVIQPPSLNEMIRMIASLGGYVIQRSTQPGTQTLWFGLRRVHDLSTAWQTFGPD